MHYLKLFFFIIACGFFSCHLPNAIEPEPPVPFISLVEQKQISFSLPHIAIKNEIISVVIRQQLNDRTYRSLSMSTFPIFSANSVEITFSFDGPLLKKFGFTPGTIDIVILYVASNENSFENIPRADLFSTELIP